MAFSIASLNCNGLRDNHKRLIVFDYFKNSRFDILYLQECHCVDESETNLWNQEFGGSGFWSYGSNLPGLNFKMADTPRDTDGCFFTFGCSYRFSKF